MEEDIDSWMDEEDEELRRLHLLILNQQIMIAHVICHIVYYLAYRKSKTKANSVCGDNVETIDDIDFRISRDEYNLEGFSVDLEGDDVEILPDGKASQVPSQSVSYSKGKRKKTETMEEVMKTSLDKISNAIERSTDAILESSASIAKFRSRVISSEEITEELEKMGVEGKFFDDAFELLTDNPEKAKKLFGYPKKGRFVYLEKLVYQI